MKKVLYEDGMEFVLKGIEMPGHNMSCLDKELEKGSIDIPCRIYLEKAPCMEHEFVARQADKENYNPACFYIESLAGRDGIDEPWQTSNWFVFYVENNGDSLLVDDTLELLDAWDYFKKEFEAMKDSPALEDKIQAAEARSADGVDIHSLSIEIER